MQDKRLQDMTLDKLWELFPRVLTPHNPQWSVWAEEEMRLLSSLKHSLLPKYKNNRDGYTEAKNEFIKHIVRLSKTN